MNKYPSSFRLPDASYSMTMDTGLLRTPFENGHHRQRRRYRTLPTVLSVSFDVKNSQKHSWLLWMQNNGFDWFEIPLPTLFEQLATDEHCKPSIVRLISDLDIQPNGGDYVRISCMMEMIPNAANSMMKPLDCMWIIAGTPAAPSADTITGGTPASRASDTYTGGDPAHPVCPI